MTHALPSTGSVRIGAVVNCYALSLKIYIHTEGAENAYDANKLA